MTLKGYVGSPEQRARWGLGDLIILGGVLVLIYGALRLAFSTPRVIRGPDIVLAPQALPYYTALSVGRMGAAYLLSLFFALAYGYAAARYRTAERGLIPLLDVLQSVPILSFLPVALVSLSAILPEGVAVELSSIFLIFTSMAWNLAFSAYQSFSTVPKDLHEASAIFQLHPWLRFRLVDLPFGMRSLVWNSMLSWSGGWFFLIAAETFAVGARDFRLPGLGSYLQAAAQAGDDRAVAWGLVALIVTVVALDQILWRPALAWAERFRIEMVESEEATRSWVYEAVSRAWVVEWALTHFWQPLGDAFDAALARLRPLRSQGRVSPRRRRFGWAIVALVLVGLGYGVYSAVAFLAQVPLDQWRIIGLAAGATAARVAIALAVAVLWTVPAGVVMGTDPRVSRVAQPAAQVVASIPATALFPVFVVALLSVAGGLNVAAVLLMLLGTQWYVLFNVMAGASSIPRDLSYTSQMLGLGPRLRWTTLTLPALYPYLITGVITASGGAWNASIVAEHVVVGGQTFQVLGIGAVIAEATARGDYAVLFAATLVLILVVVAINRLLWRQLYVRASERFRFD